MIKAAEYIRKLIAINNIEKALKCLEGFAPRLEPDLLKEIILHSGNFHRLKADKEKGLLSKGEERLEFNKLNDALVTLADALPAELEVEVSAFESKKLSLIAFLYRYQLWIQLGIWTLLALIAILLYIQPKIHLNIRLDLVANRLAFTTIEKSQLEVEKYFQSIQLNEINTITIPAQKVTLTEEEGNFVPYDVDQGFLEITPNGESERSLLFDAVGLQSLEFNANTFVSFTVPDEADIEMITIDFKPGNIQGKLVYSDSLYFELNNVVVNNLAIPAKHKKINWAKGMVYGNSDQAFEMAFNGSQDLFYITLELLEDSRQIIEEQSIFVDSLHFIRPENLGTFKSSILQAEVHFLNQQNQPYKSIKLDEFDYLRLMDYEKIQIVSLRLSDGKIKARMEGKIGRLCSGVDFQNLSLQNPNCLIWLWHNQAIVLIFIVGLGLLLSVALKIFLRKAGAY